MLKGIRPELAALANPWDEAARIRRDAVVLEAVYAGPGVQVGEHGRYTYVLIQLDKAFEPGVDEVFLGRERYTLMVPAPADEAIRALRQLAQVPEPQAAEVACAADFGALDGATNPP